MNATLCDYTGKAYHTFMFKKRNAKCGVQRLQTWFVNRKSIQDHCKVTWYRSKYITVDGEDTSSKRIVACVPRSTSLKNFSQISRKEWQTTQVTHSEQRGSMINYWVHYQTKVVNMPIMDFLERITSVVFQMKFKASTSTKCWWHFIRLKSITKRKLKTMVLLSSIQSLESAMTWNMTKPLWGCLKI